MLIILIVLPLITRLKVYIVHDKVNNRSLYRKSNYKKKVFKKIREKVL